MSPEAIAALVERLGPSAYELVDHLTAMAERIRALEIGKVDAMLVVDRSLAGRDVLVDAVRVESF
jgi:hypothetical protein